MSAAQVVDRVRNKDWTIVESSGQIDAGAAAGLTALLDAEDPEVRELAIETLREVGSADAVRPVIGALDDPDDNVRSAAVRFLEADVDRVPVPSLLPSLSDSADEYVREHVALMIGTGRDAAGKAPLRKQLAREEDVHARHAIEIALARLGDPEALERYRARLAQDDPQIRVAALDDFAYVDDRALLPDLRPLLDDRRDAVNVAPSHGSYYLRVCDVAVNAMASVVGDMPFTVEYARRYEDDQLAAARRLIDGPP